MRKNSAAKVAIQHLSFPGCDHVPDSSHSLGMPKNFARSPQLVDIKAGRGREIDGSHKHDLHVMRLIKIVFDYVQNTWNLIR